MTQEELAERAGLHVQAISKLERGVLRNPRSTTVEFLAEALKLDAHEREVFAATARSEAAARRALDQINGSNAVLASSTTLVNAEALLASLPTNTLPDRAPLPAGSRMPLAPNPLFVGRVDELLQVATALRGGDTTVALGQVVASSGLGGLGKTQLAVEFVHRYGRYFEGGVFWLSFASADEVPLQVAACAGPAFMDLAPGIDDRPIEERVQRVQRAWQSRVPRLLVFDNCEEEALLNAWRPSSGGCRVLVTSRRSHWSPTLGVTTLPLNILPRPDSVELLRRYRLDLAPGDPGLDAIAAELGDLPLALHLAGSYLRAYRAEVRLDDYLAELRQESVVQHASLLGAGFDDSISPTHHVQGVAQTFALSLGRLDQKDEADRVAIAFLARMACLAPGEPVPRDLLAKTLQKLEPRQRVDGLRRLGAAGLLEEGEGWLRLHRLLVHFVQREGLDPDARSAVELALVACGTEAFDRHLSGRALTAVIPHLIEAASRDTDDEIRKAGLCHATGLALHHAGDLSGGRSWFERALAIRDRVLGSDHPDTAQSLGDLAALLQEQGALAAARPLAERALLIRETVLGADHPATTTSLNDLASLLQEQGELAAARSIFERVLSIRERVLGPDHPRTATSLTNLGVLLVIQGDAGTAKPLVERALAIRERLLGVNHPSTVNSLNNLAALLRDQGELTAARPLFERALAICERMLGPDHPYTAFSLNNLAIQLHHQGELTDSRALYERALAIRERVLGPDHLETARTLNNLARLLQDQGELHEARRLHERALAIRERVQGPDHVLTAVSLYDMAVLLCANGEATAAARPLFERALAIRERVLGPDHPDTVATRRALDELAGEGDGAGAEG